MQKVTDQEAFQALNDAINRAVIGQEHVVRTLLLALLTNGNVLLEGLPGTAKTRVTPCARSLSNPSEITGLQNSK